jgi:hypothetical protein
MAICTVELQLFGIIGTANRPDMQKIRIIGVSFKISYVGSLKWEKNPTNGYI